MILVRGVIAQHVQVEPGALFDHRQANAPGANDRNRLARDFVAEEGKIRMPIAPLVLAREMLGGPHLTSQRAQHEKCEFGSRFGEHVGGMGERNFVTIRVGAVDVVEAHRNLRDDFQRALACLEHLGINGIAQRRDQAINS